LLLGAVGGIAWEAVRRFSEPTELVGLPIVVVASIGVVINTATALLFLRGQHDDLNIRGAFMHMAADAAVSVGVVLAGLGIYATGWNWIDPATSLGIVVVIFVGTWGLLKDSFNLAMQAVPAEIDPVAVRAYLEQIEGVTAVHDLHIWAMSTTEKALTVHLVKPQIENEDALLQDLQHELEHRFQVDHITVQIERGSGTDCHQAAPGCV
jgi:cobalt-zinc-cadmium efflux system protein